MFDLLDLYHSIMIFLNAKFFYVLWLNIISCVLCTIFLLYLTFHITLYFIYYIDTLGSYFSKALIGIAIRSCCGWILVPREMEMHRNRSVY